MPFIIEKADRSKAKVCVSLAGESQSGKTLSAIRLARGIVGKEGKIGFVDTEQCRASFYSESYGGFDVINMQPPFSPERYQEAVQTFVDAGYDVVIIDSMSHEWEGVGGVLEMAENQKYGNGNKMMGMDKWIKPKMLHKKMMTYLLNCGVHIILCYRVKQQLVESVDPKTGKKTMVRSEEDTTVTEQNTTYDMTVKLQLKNQIPYIEGKCPEALEFMFGKERITEEIGANIVEWLHGKQRNAEAIIEEGSKQKDLRAWFSSLNKFERYLATKYSGKIKELAGNKKEPEQKEIEEQEDVDF